jgi:hypothetical protein
VILSRDKGSFKRQRIFQEISIFFFQEKEGSFKKKKFLSYRKKLLSCKKKFPSGRLPEGNF